MFLMILVVKSGCLELGNLGSKISEGCCMNRGQAGFLLLGEMEGLSLKTPGQSLFWIAEQHFSKADINDRRRQNPADFPVLATG
jgi:hypothetical protein